MFSESLISLVSYQKQIFFQLFALKQQSTVHFRLGSDKEVCVFSDFIVTEGSLTHRCTETIKGFNTQLSPSKKHFKFSLYN